MVFLSRRDLLKAGLVSALSLAAPHVTVPSLVSPEPELPVWQVVDWIMEWFPVPIDAGRNWSIADFGALDSLYKLCPRTALLRWWRLKPCEEVAGGPPEIWAELCRRFDRAVEVEREMGDMRLYNDIPLDIELTVNLPAWIRNSLLQRALDSAHVRNSVPQAQWPAAPELESLKVRAPEHYAMVDKLFDAVWAPPVMIDKRMVCGGLGSLQRNHDLQFRHFPV